MSDTATNQKFIYQEILLSPYVRLTKVVGIGLCASILVVTMIVLGYRGRTKKAAPVPEVIVQHDYALPVIFTLMGVSIVGLFVLPRLKDIHNHQGIAIDGHILKMSVQGKIESINLRQSDVSFRILPMFHKLFNDQFHRIGHLKVSGKGAHYSFYFPVRNDGIISDLRKAIE